MSAVWAAGGMRNRKLPGPTESEDQKALIRWAELSRSRFPALRWLHAIPNGGARDLRTAGRLKAEGVSPGVPDLCLPVPTGKYHGAYVEMKRTSGSRLNARQKQWGEHLEESGYAYCVAYGFEEARDFLIGYLAVVPQRETGIA